MGLPGDCYRGVDRSGNVAVRPVRIPRRRGRVGSMFSSVTEFPPPPAHGYRGEVPTPTPPPRLRGLTVAVSREAGARGGTIARKVGELLGWQVFDNEAVEYLVQNDTARNQFLAEL